nr:MAG TPA: hypothetical protein [Caudoviricetes sp.]
MLNNPLNCWKFLKLSVPQRSDEMHKCDGDESRKKRIDGTWLNPKCCKNG